MNVWVNANGTRNRCYRPYIEQEEQANSVYYYDPFRPFHYGLYDMAQPSCGSMRALYYQYKALPQYPQK